MYLFHLCRQLYSWPFYIFRFALARDKRKKELLLIIRRKQYRRMQRSLTAFHPTTILCMPGQAFLQASFIFRVSEKES